MLRRWWCEFPCAGIRSFIGEVIDHYPSVRRAGTGDVDFLVAHRDPAGTQEVRTFHVCQRVQAQWFVEPQGRYFKEKLSHPDGLVFLLVETKFNAIVDVSWLRQKAEPCPPSLCREWATEAAPPRPDTYRIPLDLDITQELSAIAEIVDNGIPALEAVLRAIQVKVHAYPLTDSVWTSVYRDLVHRADSLRSVVDLVKVLRSVVAEQEEARE
jgi:hypothetical protein